MVKIALDAMGGDFAPFEILKGASLALNDFEVTITLFGPKDVLEPAILAFPNLNSERVDIVDSPDTVAMSESPSVSFRHKKNSSIQLGLKAVKEKKCDAFISAGNTGAVMMASTLILGRIPNVERPAIASLIPTPFERPVVMLDMGSSVDCKPIHLAQFATMGDCFARAVLKEKSPRVGLLNIGEESEKGNAVVQAAHDLLEQLPINFIGNVEGKDILKGVVDVVVCDGFVGNVLLKFGEGITSIFMDFFRSQAKSSGISKLGLLLLKPALKKFKKKYDHEEYGGAPLLGVNGVSMIAHGSSSAWAIRNAIQSAIKEVDSGVIEKLIGAVES